MSKSNENPAPEQLDRSIPVGQYIPNETDAESEYSARNFEPKLENERRPDSGLKLVWGCILGVVLGIGFAGLCLVVVFFILFASCFSMFK